MGDNTPGPGWPAPDDPRDVGFGAPEGDDSFVWPDPEPDPAHPGGAYGGGPADAAGPNDPHGPDGPDGPDAGGTPADGTPAAAGEPGRTGMTRRQALGVLGATGVVGAGLIVAGRRILTDEVAASDASQPRSTTSAPLGTTTTTTAPPTTPPPPVDAKWSDPNAWGGAVPGEGDVAVVKSNIMLDVDAKVAGVSIEPGGRLSFDPKVGHTLQSTGNVVVRGTLQMRPSAAAVHQTLVFPGVDEGRYRGGHIMEPLDSDVGLWVLDDGVCDLVGAAKSPWTRLTGGAAAGAGSITVKDASGWQVGDEIVVTPTEPATVDENWAHHDRRVITAVAGNQVSLDEPLSHPHDPVTVRAGVTHMAEVLNLSRNVRIEGTPDGRAHIIFLHGHKAQQLSHVGLRHLGPRQSDSGVVGRYGLHFHMCDDGTKGSKVTGLTAYDCGNHAFVLHLSNGITLDRCVTHDTVGDAYWWDMVDEGEDASAIPTHGAIYDHCVASYTHQSDDDPYSTTAFLMGTGVGNEARACVAVGTMGNTESASGFGWPDKSRNETDIWLFEDCIAHNCKSSGIYYWQNVVARTIVDRFTAFHNSWGIWAGAYANLVSYRDCNLAFNGQGGLEIKAVPDAPQQSPDETITYEGMYVDQAGLSDFAATFHGPVVGGDRATLISDSVFRGGKKAQVTFQTGAEPGDDAAEDTEQNYSFTNCTFEGNAFWLEDGVREDANIRVSDSQHGTVMLHRSGSSGSGKSEWNATTTPA